MRLFFAVSVPSEITGAASRLQSLLRESADGSGIGWTEPDLFHLTLRFLGEVSAAVIPRVSEAAAAAATQFSPFEIHLGGVGAFPSTSRPKVIWAGVREGFPDLARLAECLNGELERRGIEREERAFSAHVTLARIKSPEGERAAKRALGTLSRIPEDVDKLGVIRVQEFVLMESEIGAQVRQIGRGSGPRYTRLGTFSLFSRTTPADATREVSSTG